MGVLDEKVAFVNCSVSGIGGATAELLRLDVPAVHPARVTAASRSAIEALFREVLMAAWTVAAGAPVPSVTQT